MADKQINLHFIFAVAIAIIVGAFVYIGVNENIKRKERELTQQEVDTESYDDVDHYMRMYPSIREDILLMFDDNTITVQELEKIEKLVDRVHKDKDLRIRNKLKSNILAYPPQE